MFTHIYAEHLPRIHALSIQASLSTPANATTEASISADCKSFTLTHNGQEICIDLPINVPESFSGVSLPCASSKSPLEFRIPLSADPASNGMLTQTVGDDDVLIPWTAPSLSSSTEICCKACEIVLVTRGKIQSWSDLPSEHWAEMMDLWHCHKPHEPHSRDHDTSDKAYTAGSRLIVTSTIGLVDAVSFLIAVEDSQNVKNSSIVATQPLSDKTLSCVRCDASIGIIDRPTQGYKLAKHALSISTSLGEQRQAFNVSKWLACRLLNARAYQGVSKFVLSSDNDAVKPMLVWIFTPDLTISSSASARPGPLRVMRAYWKDVPASYDPTRLDSQSLSEGDIELPSFELAALRSCLEESTVLLPQNVLRLPGWQVGLLEQFESSETA